MIKIYDKLLGQLKSKKPLIHYITNYVSVNDCANITLAIGASPIMADAIKEVREIVNISSALVINIGTLNELAIESMLVAGKEANKVGIPVVLDPVGVGATKLRNETVEKILSEVKVDILKGNSTEIKFIAGLATNTNGVDALEKDIKNTEDNIFTAKKMASKYNCIVAVTGVVDVVTDGSKVIVIENGSPLLAEITGTGCMCSGLIAAFGGAMPKCLLQTTTAALLTMGISGEIAAEKAFKNGNGSFKVELQNAVSRITAETVVRKAKIFEK